MDEIKRIFVTLGSQKFQFNRLLMAVDQLVEDRKLKDVVFAQAGYSDYKPRHFGYKSFLNKEGFSQEISRADIVITHGGTGVIVESIKKRKKVIAVPRLKKYGEHVDDHQLQLVEQFRDSDLICGCIDLKGLGEAIDTVKKTDYQIYKSNTERLIESIERFVEDTARRSS